MNTNKDNKPNVKKKSRFFSIYISKVLQQVAPRHGITSNAKQQLNSILYWITTIISDTALALTINAKKRTISTREISNALRIVLTGSLAKHSISEGNKAELRYTDGNSHGNRQNKAGIIFPPSIIEKFLRRFNYNKVMVAETSPIHLAAAIEYITAEILEVSSNNVERNRVRITIRHLELAVQSDTEISDLFNRYNLQFLGGGVTPYIHPVLLIKKPYKRVIPPIHKKTRKFHPGTVAIREIKRYQKMSNCLTLPRSPFEKLVRQIILKVNENPVKVSEQVFLILQYFIEQYIVNIVQKANNLAIYTGRVKLLSNDINFILRTLGETKEPETICELDADNFQLSNTISIVEYDDIDVEKIVPVVESNETLDEEEKDQTEDELENDE